MNIDDIVLIRLPHEGCDFVGFYGGIKEYLGIKYHLVSPYTDDRPSHYLAFDVDIEIIKALGNG